MFIGAWIGSILAFILGRYVFRQNTEALASKYKITRALDRAIREEGLKFVILLRLCPLVPFNAFNYIMGVTGVSFGEYALGGIGMLPGTIVYVFVGTTVGSLTDLVKGDTDTGVLGLILLIVGSALACFLIIFVSIKVKGYLTEAVEQGEDLNNLTEEINNDEMRNLITQDEE